MNHVLIIHAFDPCRPTGVSRLIRQLCSHLRRRGCKVTLAMPAIPEDFSHVKEEWEAFAEKLGQIALLWWEKADFTKPQRERLVHNLERLHSQDPLGHIFAVGVAQCGFATAIACRIMDVPFSVFATYRDALCYHSLHPQEIETSVTHAFRIATTNPHVLQHIRVFHQVQERLLLVDPRPDRKQIKAELKGYKSVSDEDEPYLVTTGHLDQYMHLRELVNRIRSVASSEALGTWRHLGSCCPVAKTQIESMLATQDGPVLMHDVEVVPRSRYAQIVSKASVHLIPQGESDTNSAAYESEMWGVKTDYPDGHCFPKLRQRKRTLQFGKVTVSLSGIEQLAEDIAH